ncbi:reverse transcriptase domain-containing protein [Tanacetum coccineum]
MIKNDEEKTAFHIEEGVFCYTKMPFGLKNAKATYQRLVDSAFKEQIGVNLEAYVDDIVIKSQTEQDIIQDKDFRWTEATKAAFLEMKKLVSELPTLTTPKKGETLMMFLAVADEAVSAKLTLALVHATKRLRRYFQAYPIKVITDSQIKKVLSNSKASGRLAKWDVELGAYGIQYVPRVAVKESSNARENLAPSLKAWRLYTDGASNSGGSGDGLILIAPGGVEYSYALRLNFSNSNNDVEYEGLLAGLLIAIEMQVKDIHAFVDSKLVASQVEGSYEAKGENDKIPETRMLLEDPIDAITLMEKIRNYALENGVMYRKSYLVLLMRFGIPAIIVTDNETQFVNDPFKKWAKKLKIKLILTSIYHP